MIHVDRNQHTPVLSAHSKQNIIISAETQLRDWTESSPRKQARISSPLQPETILPGPTTPKDNQPITANPEAPSTPASPADGNSTSPTREHSSSSLSPVTDTHSSPPPATTNSTSNLDASALEQQADDKASRQSTPLSELSPPPDDDEDEKKETENSTEDADTKKELQELPEHPSNPYPTAPASSTSPHDTQPQPGGKDPKVVAILDLNSELFKALLEFQTRGMNSSDTRFQQFASRLQSNLNYLATAADRPSSLSTTSFPPMDPPPPIDFLPMERIQQLYADLPSIFSRSIARHPSASGMGGNNLKRERPDEGSSDPMAAHKRRDIGEGKSTNGGLMPPPSLPFQDQLSNGIPSSSSSSTASGSSPMPMTPQLSVDAMSGMNSPAPSQNISGTGNLPNAGMSEAQMNQATAAMRERRMTSIRAQQPPGIQPSIPSTPQQQGGRHMSPPSSAGGSSNQQMSPTSTHGGGIGGPSAPMGNSGLSNNTGSGSGGLSMQQLQQQAFALLQTQPPHPIVQYAARMIPNFSSLPMQDQAKRIFQVNLFACSL
ncbi:hypothetical protein BDP27DRAFT_809798 [Rhodocollybia butyracea]|uniref:SS18 N-terminal domain-containing protein n=1 Tax=Rhodocollybia butyracea TaxID=206335 RepID=A0A9P5Q8K9_9AGAR|nr:hypothetical protein BDP27DRAFT_809798 [Rhodocollybia butyracea]